MFVEYRIGPKTWRCLKIKKVNILTHYFGAIQYKISGLHVKFQALMLAVNFKSERRKLK